MKIVNKFPKCLFVAVMPLLISMQSLAALDLDVNVQAGNFPYLDSGTFSKKMPDFGFAATIKDDFTGIIGASFKIERMPIMGNMLKARLSFGTENISFELGPSIGILNKAHGKKEFSTTFQPGFGVGMQVLTKKGFLALFDLDFSIFTGLSDKNIYLNNGLFQLGMRTEHTLISLSVTQLTRTSTIDTATTSSLTDFALNFEVFSKPSRIVFPLSTICRISKYNNAAQSEKNVSLLTVVLKTGLRHNIHSDLSYYVTAEFPVYTHTLKGIDPKIFRYTVTAGFAIGFD